MAHNDSGEPRNLVERHPDGSLTKETIKRAMKAYRKRLKLARLDDESTSGRNPLSAGHKSAICAIVPPEQYPPDVWEDLAALGRLRAIGEGLYELVEQ